MPTAIAIQATLIIFDFKQVIHESRTSLFADAPINALFEIGDSNEGLYVSKTQTMIGHQPFN
jgi:hypothetical protein